MTSFRVRPRFKIAIEGDPNQLTQRFKQCPFGDCVIESVPGYVTLKVNQEDRHFWSPQLSLVLEESEDGNGTEVNGLYGPNGNVWTLFAFGYMALGILITFISIIGFSQRSLGMECKILWTLPFLIGGLVILYFISQFGQKLGAEQMFTLHHAVERILDRKIHIQ